MTRLLDTNVVSTYLKPDAKKRFPELVSRVDQIVAEEGLTISAVTLYELRRGLLDLELRGQGRSARVRTEKLLRIAYPLGLDHLDFTGWDRAAELWARGRRVKPAVVFEEGDLLIAATALAHGRTLVTCEARLRDGLIASGIELDIEVIEVA